MLRGKEAAPVRIYSILYIIYIMLSGIKRERERKRKKEKRNQSKTPKGERLPSIVSDRESSVVLKEKLLLYGFIIKCRCQLFS